LNTNKIESQKRRWSERAEIALRQGQTDLVMAVNTIISIYDSLAATPELTEPEILIKVNLLRKQIEASEQHRTMCVEHGLSDAAIDATYEIQDLEKQLIKLCENL
jgi:phage shock protein A